ncbi:hypothetical protein SLEP1_g25979 [Rubroshorea leprosula]|uniref:PIN-like protein n=1 Tax=Rubroshorea leprosula TaxID=152421 RepID=A0AAV5JNM0_9ROSI|nr:hypothetical protein SLEP1_g25979 [Rubroshorea leprosula]
MISRKDLSTVLKAVIPLYVAMILAYGLIRWWKIFSPDQFSGINCFVAIFTVPLVFSLYFHQQSIQNELQAFHCLIAMYGHDSGSLMVQVAVLQCIIWYTLLLFLFEYRGAKILIMEQFSKTAARLSPSRWILTLSHSMDGNFWKRRCNCRRREASCHFEEIKRFSPFLRNDATAIQSYRC